jgi:hypothetical protein
MYLQVALEADSSLNTHTLPSTYDRNSKCVRGGNCGFDVTSRPVLGLTHIRVTVSASRGLNVPVCEVGYRTLSSVRLRIRGALPKLLHTSSWRYTKDITLLNNYFGACHRSGGLPPNSQRGGPGSRLQESMLDLWRTKLHWGRFFSEIFRFSQLI